MISNIRLQSFRSYYDQSFEFEPGVNIVVGPNACGKTNLLEAIGLLTSGSTIRAKDNDIIAFGKDWARLDGYVANTNRSVKVSRVVGSVESVQKEFVIEGKSMRRLSANTRQPVVVFEPNHLQLLHGSQDGRREFLDNLLGYIVPDFMRTSRDYKKTLAQRNRLLKNGEKDKQHMFVWNVRLSELAAQIVQARIDLLSEINEGISGIYSGIADKKSEIRFSYLSSCGNESYATTLLKKLEASEELDYLRGFTAHGPRRDDVDIVINNKRSAAVASRGETRT